MASFAASLALLFATLIVCARGAKLSPSPGSSRIVVRSADSGAFGAPLPLKQYLRLRGGDSGGEEGVLVAEDDDVHFSNRALDAGEPRFGQPLMLEAVLLSICFVCPEELGLANQPFRTQLLKVVALSVCLQLGVSLWGQLADAMLWGKDTWKTRTAARRDAKARFMADAAVNAS